MPSSSSCARLAAWTITAVLLQILGLSLFVFGFFPVKPTLLGVSGPESYQKPNCSVNGSSQEGRNLPPDQLRSLYKEMSEIPPAFDQVIMMVIDGLPAEFVLGRGNMPPTKAMMEAMPYTQSLLSSGNAIGYRAKAAPPTVTMPRLKAIISGAIGGFLDVAFNFNTQAFLDDNVLEQLHHIGWKMVMLGDETWIKLFPGLFSRQDGVNSFFVKDTIEVDFNVSRHLEYELAATDWNLLILHYLGLDHVGHIGGRHCVLMQPKLKEMDKIIRKIYTSTILHHNNDNKRTLLMVVSDHGMTDGGNHGGSSYEETDSLALFMGLGGMSELASVSHGTAFQVDIAPTLALLLGVPIPKNSVGVFLSKILDFLTDEQKLRALELNSWQLLRLLQAQLPGVLCGDTSSDGFSNYPQISKVTGNIEERICSLYSKAVDYHKSWKYLNGSRTMPNVTENFTATVAAYREFLKTASGWLSRRATDKPASLLTAGIGIMLVSSCALLKILFSLFKEIKLIQKKNLAELKDYCCKLSFDQIFIILGILFHIFSLCASSMVEEEQCTWHFLASTLYLIFLFIKIQAFLMGQEPSQIKSVKEEERYTSFENDVTFFPWLTENRTFLWKARSHFQIFSLLLVLICGRILRGWYQGGVNWTQLPDISKWLERSGTLNIKAFQIASLFLIIILSSLTFFLVRPKRFFVVVILISHCLSGILILLHVIKSRSPSMMAVTYTDNLTLQMFYTTLLGTVITASASPWFIDIHFQKTVLTTKPDSRSSVDLGVNSLLPKCIQDCTYLIGGAFMVSWCLLQLLLQHPLNAMPIVLLLVQILASITYFTFDGSYQKQWVEVSAMYFLGMAGHFGLGNSNSISTVDVAGAFTGLSSHSTVLAGILMFIITYASPLLFFLGIIMCQSSSDLKLLSERGLEFSKCLLVTTGFHCLLPLVLNSAVLTSFTIILVLMRNHLFVWSVFSPKYLYICAATLSVYIGVSIIAATRIYICSVIYFRVKKASSKVSTS